MIAASVTLCSRNTESDPEPAFGRRRDLEPEPNLPRVPGRKFLGLAETLRTTWLDTLRRSWSHQ